MLGIGAFRVFMGTRLNIEPYSPLKPIKVGFIFIRPNSLSRAEDLAAVNHRTQAVVRVGSKIGSIKVGFKELRVTTRAPRAKAFKSRPQVKPLSDQSCGIYHRCSLWKSN